MCKTALHLPPINLFSQSCGIRVLNFSFNRNSIDFSCLLDRYFAVCHPYRYRDMTQSCPVSRRVVSYVGPVVALSVILNIPKFFETRLIWPEETSASAGLPKWVFLIAEFQKYILVNKRQINESNTHTLQAWCQNSISGNYLIIWYIILMKISQKHWSEEAADWWTAATDPTAQGKVQAKLRVDGVAR